MEFGPLDALLSQIHKRAFTCGGEEWLRRCLAEVAPVSSLSGPAALVEEEEGSGGHVSMGEELVTSRSRRQLSSVPSFCPGPEPAPPGGSSEVVLPPFRKSRQRSSDVEPRSRRSSSRQGIVVPPCPAAVSSLPRGSTNAGVPVRSSSRKKRPRITYSPSRSQEVAGRQRSPPSGRNSSPWFPMQQRKASRVHLTSGV
ncbi:splicing factor, arginine/serine-rich 19-like [Bufo bufo]|uniref:splicing factor, arginine/serine-rich 19-like n=1 Tax=Bufo bufo TaxID=8384 RepID=UPI001ABDF766|nr:splicing factor, arginine/serine-rich 19-like [Bufo bufo]